MSNNINKFYEALKADEGLKSRFNELRAKNENSDEAMTLIADFAASEGFPFTAEEFAASIKSMQRELDDSELEAVDGGIAIASANKADRTSKPTLDEIIKKLEKMNYTFPPTIYYHEPLEEDE